MHKKIEALRAELEYAKKTDNLESLVYDGTEVFALLSIIEVQGEALKKYGDHMEGCAKRQHGTREYHRCNCGFDDALKDEYYG